MPKPVTLAAIDAGSNAIRMRIVRAGKEGVETLATERVPVRLGRGAFSTGNLDSEVINSAVMAFERFRELFDQHEVSVYRAVATSAVRSVGNRERLIDRLFREAGIELEVIDGAEEGRLVRKAVLSQFTERRPPDMVLDLGGGSLEAMRDQEGRWLSSSVKIGTVRLLEVFGLKGDISEDERKMIRRFVRSTIRGGVDDAIREKGTRRAVFCGGNAECLAAILGDRDKSGMAYLSTEKLRDELTTIASLNVKERMAEYDVRKDRAEVMGVAAIVIAAVGKELGLDGFLVPGVGLREGVIQDLAEAAVGKLGPGSKEPVLASARSFADRLGHHTKHSEHVRMVSERLFDQLEPVHGLPRPCAVALQLAAILHDLGEVVHRKGHHKHSEYLIMQGRIPGLESPMREMAAATARAHRKSLPNGKKHKVFDSLEAKQQKQVLKMCILLRLANALDTNRKNQVVPLSAEIKKDRVLLFLSTPKADALEGAHLAERCEEFEEVFGRKLILEVSEE